MTQKYFGDNSTSVNIGAIKLYLNQYWPKSMSPYIVTRTQFKYTLDHKYGYSRVQAYIVLIVLAIFNEWLYNCTYITQLQWNVKFK